MEDLLNNLKAHAKGVSLTAEEKISGREALRSYMALTPNRTLQVSKPARFGFLRLSYAGRAAGVFAASLTLLLSAGGISYAAEGSVPGDTLYPVKVSFNEPILAAMAVSEKDRAEWSAERASRRLAEAEVLASRGALRAETRVALDADFKHFSEGAELHLAKVREEEDGDGVAADVSAHIEGTLRAHSQIMNALAEDRREKRKADKADAKNDDPGSDDDTQQVVALAASVSTQADSTAKEGDDEAHDSSKDTAKAAGFARGRHDAAVKKIAEVRAWLKLKAGTFTADSVTEANARLSAADDAVASGDASQTAGKSRQAFMSYAKAQRLAQEAKLIVRASNDLGVRIRFQNAGDAEVDGAKDDGNADSNDDSENAGLNLNVGAGLRLDGKLFRDKNGSQQSGDRRPHEDRGGRND